MAKKGKGKMKVSKLKHSNQVITKLRKQGRIKNQRHRKKKQHQSQPVNNKVTQEKASQEFSDNESIQGSDMLDMMEEDDINYIKNMAKSSSSNTFLQKIHKATNAKHNKNKLENEELDEEENLELEYRNNEPVKKNSKNKKHLLPIKTRSGIIERELEDDEEEMSDGNDDDADENGIDSPMSESDDETISNNKLPDSETKKNMSATEILVIRHKEIQAHKLKIGLHCSGILENPELKVDNFFGLLYMMDEKTKDGKENLLTVRRLAAVSILEVFKDILPDYQIAQQNFEGVKLKKDTLLLNKYENSLLAHYKRYLQRLEKMTSVLVKKKGDSRKTDSPKLKLANIAVNCLCDLLASHSYFNYSSNIAQMLVPFLNNKASDIRETVCECFKSVFKNDKKGVVSLMLVRKINQLVKTRSNDVFCEVLNCLLALRIKDVNLDEEKKLEMKQKKQMSHKQRLLSMSKNERKRSKKLKELEKEMLETKAEENKQSKQQNLTEIVKVVFMIYFRILKRFPNSKLLGATLEGISKFAHVINLEYYSDLVNLLDYLLKDADLGYREQLHCVDTVFTILSGQGEVLNIDPSRFYTHLYSNLLTIHCGKNHNDFNIVLRATSSVLIKRRKKISSQIIMSYMKRLATCGTQLMHNGTLACLGLIKSVIQQTKMTEILLELDEELGSGKYDPYLMEPEYCNAMSSAMYELVVLRRHYHPTVRTMAQHILNGVPSSGEGSLPAEIGKLSPQELFNLYDGSQIAFKPAIPPPKTTAPKSRPARHVFTQHNFEEYCNLAANKATKGTLNFYQDYTV